MISQKEAFSLSFMCAECSTSLDKHDLELQSQVDFRKEMTWGNSPDTKVESTSVSSWSPRYEASVGDEGYLFEDIWSFYGEFGENDCPNKSYAIGFMILAESCCLHV
ncbi:unnamed protein product [Albugo candida]|uniref:Uncharacterized protein n=1 Tax=Albugo candida TaxID=65357 RepID=A0A024G377_9STRA|nr:unnamed protein product [Albugo candida]|eukprot:CCI41298.1 unnamed protein product [Albugo candida]